EARQRTDEAVLPEDTDRLLADAVDVGDRSPVDQGLEATGGAGAVRAAVHRLALGLHHFEAAERAVRRHPELLRTAPMRPRRTDDLRNDVACALDDDVVALADLLAVDVLFVVQRRAGDRDAADLHRLHDRPRVESAGAAHTDA